MTLGEMYGRKNGRFWALSEDKKSVYAKALQQKEEFIEREMQKRKEKEEENKIEKEIEKKIEKTIEQAIEDLFKEIQK